MSASPDTGENLALVVTKEVEGCFRKWDNVIEEDAVVSDSSVTVERFHCRSKIVGGAKELELFFQKLIIILKNKEIGTIL